MSHTLQLQPHIDLPATRMRRGRRRRWYKRVTRRRERPEGSRLSNKTAAKRASVGSGDGDRAGRKPIVVGQSFGRTVRERRDERREGT